MPGRQMRNENRDAVADRDARQRTGIRDLRGPAAGVFAWDGGFPASGRTGADPGPDAGHGGPGNGPRNGGPGNNDGPRPQVKIGYQIADENADGPAGISATGVVRSAADGLGAGLSVLPVLTGVWGEVQGETRAGGGPGFLLRGPKKISEILAGLTPWGFHVVPISV